MTRLTWILVLALAGCSGADPTQDDDPPVETRGLGTLYRSASSWTDDTAGPLMTLVYISATGSSEDLRPYPLIYSSDPNNTYFHRENTPKLTVRRLRRDEMQRFLRELEVSGLNDLPWEPFGFREQIGPKRAFYRYKDGSCRHVLKSPLADAPRVIFTRIENRIIALNRE